jgi:hypothetical protein
MRIRILSAVVGVTLALAVAAPAHATTLWATTPNNRLVQFDSASPNTLGPSVDITGLQTNESILGIDFRPASGQLYALGSASRLYTINLTTGAATGVGPLTIPLSGSNFGFDFNPITDRIRIVSNTNQNLSVDPANAYAMSDGNLTYGTMQVPNAPAAAYSNNFAGATSTNFYLIDTNANTLVMGNESSGQLSLIGDLGVNPDDFLGFDIGGDNTAFFLNGVFLHLVNLSNGNSPSMGMTSEIFTTLAIAPQAGSGGPGPGPGPGTQPPPGPLGDFDLDGDVDAADLIFIRRINADPSSVFVPIRAPDELDGTTDELDFQNWRMSFGQPAGGSAVAAQRRRQVALVKTRRRVTLGAGQTKRVKLPLTKAGKRFLRKYRRKRLKVTLRFTVRHRPAAGAADQRTFKRKVTLRVKRKRR